jgi:hypothetical protein
MELKLTIDCSDLLQLVRRLPASQFYKLKSEINTSKTPVKKDEEKAAFLELLLNGPIIPKEEYQQT